MALHHQRFGSWREGACILNSEHLFHSDSSWCGDLHDGRGLWCMPNPEPHEGGLRLTSFQTTRICCHRAAVHNRQIGRVSVHGQNYIPPFRRVASMAIETHIEARGGTWKEAGTLGSLKAAGFQGSASRHR